MANFWHEGDIIRVTAKMVDSTTGDIQNVYHFKYGGSDVAEESAIGNILAIIDDMYDDIQPAMPADMIFHSIDVANVTQSIVYAARNWPTQVNGGGTGDTMPEQNCALVVGRTDYPKTVARKFLGPFIEADNADGSWASGLFSALGDFMTKYLTTTVFGSNSTLAPVAVHYVNNAVTRVSEILSGYCTNYVYTQRRRRRGVGS